MGRLKKEDREQENILNIRKGEMEEYGKGKEVDKRENFPPQKKRGSQS